MFRVTTSTALLLYLGCFLFICLGIWFRSHMKQRKKVTLPPLYELKTCEYCSYAYLGVTGETITRCPECGSLNRSE